LDEVRGNASILSGIAKPTSQVQAICVKFIFIKSLYQKMIDANKASDMMSPLEKLAEPSGVAGAMDQMKQKSGGLPADLMEDFDFDLIDNCSYV
jgi:hypothetical protein